MKHFTDRSLAQFMFSIIAPGSTPVSSRRSNTLALFGALGWGIEVHASPFQNKRQNWPIAYVFTGRIFGTARLNFVGHEFTFMPTHKDAELVANWVRFVIDNTSDRVPFDPNKAPPAWPFVEGGLDNPHREGWEAAINGHVMPGYVWTVAAHQASKK